MNTTKKILIVDDNPQLRKQLKYLIKLVIPDNWKILEVDNHDDAIKVIKNNNFNILVCDLFLSSNELNITKTSFIPEGIQVAKTAKEIYPQLFTIVVTSNLDSFLRNDQLINYIDAGVNAFFDRSVVPHKKFTEPFQYQLKMAIKHLDNSVFTLWQSQSLKYCHSYCILIGNPDGESDRNLMRDILIWEKTLFTSDASVLLVQFNDNKLFYLIENKIIDDINNCPILLISKSPKMLENIKIGSRTLKIIQDKSSITKFLNLIHAQLHYNDISKIQKQMELPSY